MNIEQLVCTIEQAKKLNKLGVTAQSQYYYVAFGTDTGQSFALCRPTSNIERSTSELTWLILGEINDEMQHKLDEGELCADGPVYPAYTLGELMRMAGVDGVVTKMEAKTSVQTKWEWFSLDIEKDDSFGNFMSPEIAAADMLIRQLEKGYITPEQCNAALREKGGQQ